MCIELISKGPMSSNFFFPEILWDNCVSTFPMPLKFLGVEIQPPPLLNLGHQQVWISWGGNGRTDDTWTTRLDFISSI